MKKKDLLFLRSMTVLLLLSIAFFCRNDSDLNAWATELSPLEEKYTAAKNLLFSRQFDTAFEMFDELGDYKDSLELTEYARNYIENEPEYGDPFFQERYIVRSCPAGKLYSLSRYGSDHNPDTFRGIIYLPDQIDSTTTFVQYFCGGGYGEDYLWYRGLYAYFDEYSPNSVFVFTNESGTTRIQRRLELQWNILRQIAWECGTIVHDISSIGSSNGSYTALKLVSAYYMNYGLKTVRTLTLDTGASWDLGVYNLTREECEAAAEAGTKFYFFEGPDFSEDLQKQPIKDILESGIPATAMICRHADHDTISRNAYAFGLFSFCGGEDMELPAAEYCPVRLYEGIMDLGDFSWQDLPL